MKKKFAFALIMGVITTGIISFTVIFVNIGFKPNFLKIWSKSWGLAYLVVIPAILIIGPRIQKLVDWLFDKKDIEI
ncbi:DUF2798 domain-containing protein [Sphingobacterium olei]|uniref:DUF2798 domain-containing protein n=1 Tax=Sphingobacterium olei TaxID=2571155 RepID=A0A4U0NHK5_9SPHI|nr:DUF2798 domain-containing protein [Sphingobacterium olei]TJZ53685.1 DUF2798 domain-containing protein [Sphingobacterium olei]